MSAPDTMHSSGKDTQEKRPSVSNGKPSSTTDEKPPLRAALKRTKRANSMDLDDYFVGPLDPNRHSKWPYFLRMHGSVMPKLLLPLLFVGGWATAITLISKLVDGVNLAIDSLLLTVLGFVVGLSLSFRSTTAYERYAEGRRLWATLILTSRNLTRVIWIHAKERDGAEGKNDLLAKLTALNLVNAYALALKHKLRYEPYADYEDIAPLVSHLDTFARDAQADREHLRRPNKAKAVGGYLGVSFAESNPRKELKRAKKPLGNLPLEILTYLSAYLEEVFSNETLKVSVMQTQTMNFLATMNEVLTGTERILATPLPLAYSIAISQITWVYVLILPFQLLSRLNWVTIPGTLVAAYIILGLAAIGREIENPFGSDVNDLPLESYCEQIGAEIDILTASPPVKLKDFVTSSENLVLYPLSKHGYSQWNDMAVEDIREALRTRAALPRKGQEDLEKQDMPKNEEQV